MNIENIDVDAMLIGENWAAVIEDNNGILIYNRDAADAETGWCAVPDEKIEKYLL